MNKTVQPEKPDMAIGDRIAKVIARSGYCSRRQAEALIAEGKVKVNGSVLETPAFKVTSSDQIEIDDKPLAERDRTRLWLFHKPKGLVTTNRDPEGRPTVFSALPSDMPRVVSIGRLDINTEGLLLLTNDGGLARILELPATGWLRRYRVRAHGTIGQDRLDRLRDGIVVDGIAYGSIEATLDRKQGSNSWITLALREGKNREVKRILEDLGLSVNRLIRISYGPFQLGALEPRAVEEVRTRILRDQLGTKLAEAAGADFSIAAKQVETEPTKPAAEPSKKGRATRKGPRKDKNARALASGRGEKDDPRPSRRGTRKTRTKPSKHAHRRRTP